MRHWLRRTWFRIANLVGIISAIELLTNVFGTAGPLLDSLREPYPDVARFAALVFGSFFILMFLVWFPGAFRSGVIGLLQLTKDDWRAARRFHEGLGLIRSCRVDCGEITDGLGFERIGAAEARMDLLHRFLDEIGIVITNEHSQRATDWIRRLDKLEVYAQVSDIKAARRWVAREIDQPSA